VAKPKRLAITRRFIATLAVILVAGGLAMPLKAATDHASHNRAAAPTGVRLVVQFRHGHASSAIAALQHAGVHNVHALAHLDAAVVTVPKAGVDHTLNVLRATSGVANAGEDAMSKPAEQLPNDPFFPQTYALSGGAWGWYKTRATQAWDVTTGDPSVVIAIVDTGLRNVSDFAGQTVPGWNVTDNTGDTSTNAGVHGTYVAGVAGLALGNGMGNAGFCPNCKIMPVQAGTDSGAYDSDLANGITWAADHGARVINLSWAGTASSSLLTDAVAYARNKGAVVVAAAGNTNCDCPNYPAATAGVIGVAGTTNTDTKQGDSNYGSWVSVAAPEGNMTAWPVMNGAPGYGPVGGTSLAAPVVAGIAGLVFSYQPTLSGTAVEQAIESSTVPMPFSVKYGRVDAMSALAAVGASDPQPSSAPVSNAPPQVLALSSTNSADTTALSAAPVVGQVLARGQGGWQGTAPLSVSAVRWQHCDANNVCTTVGTAAKYTVQSADAGYALQVAISVKNGIGTTTMTSPPTLPVGSSGTVTTTAPATTTVPPPPPSTTTLPATTTTDTAAPTTTTTPPPAVTTTTLAPVPPAATLTSTWSGSLNQKQLRRTFGVSAGAGKSHATLAFNCSSLTLDVGAGTVTIGSTTGPSVITYDVNIPAGSDSWTVSGKAKCSFTLTVTTPSP
jgi:hypothetical protein